MKKKFDSTKLLKSEILDYSGLNLSLLQSIPKLRVGNYRVVDDSVGGDAPKDFIRVYEYGKANRTSSRNWPAFIAKVGHKWYPNESIIEQYLTRLGQALGFQVADSRLMMAHGQLRFLSRYFLNRRAGESLIHGAEIFAGFLAKQSGKDEKDFVQQVEDENMSRVMFTFQFVENAIRSEFPDDAPEIIHSFIDLLAFDAIVGNNDRHFFSWGVIDDVRWHRQPVFSPIYDTARALFWNTTDEKLEAKAQAPVNEREAFLRKYIKNSHPKTGWDGLEKPTHFDVISNIAKRDPEYRKTLEKWEALEIETHAGKILESSEFQDLIVETRKDFMLQCITKRYHLFQEAVSC